MNHAVLPRPDPIRAGILLVRPLGAFAPLPPHSPNTTTTIIITNSPNQTDTHTRVRAKVQEGSHARTHTHKHADLADSSAVLIADLNRPGDLSLSLTHTGHTSFFFSSSLHPLPQTLPLPPARVSVAFSSCRFALLDFCTPQLQVATS